MDIIEVELGELGVGSEEELLALWIEQSEPGEQPAGVLHRRDVVTRRPFHRLDGLALDLIDRLRLGEDVAGPIVRRRGVGRVQHRVDAEDGEEEETRQEVLHRNEAPRQVDDVEGDEGQAKDGDVSPGFVVDGHDQPGHGDGVGGAEQEDLDHPPGDRPAAATAEDAGVLLLEGRRPARSGRRVPLRHGASRRSATGSARRRR